MTRVELVTKWWLGRNRERLLECVRDRWVLKDVALMVAYEANIRIREGEVEAIRGQLKRYLKEIEK